MLSEALLSVKTEELVGTILEIGIREATLVSSADMICTTYMKKIVLAL